MSFRRNVVAMLSGTAMAQAIPLALSPLLARLYSPESFGLQTLFMGWAAALGVVATCRYDLAIVLPDDEREADDLAALVLAIAAATLSLLVLGVLLFADPLSALSGHAGRTAWLWLLVPMLMGTALTLLGTAYASRSRDFTRIAKASVANQAAYGMIAVAIGYAGAQLEGLVWAKVGGQAVGLAVILAGFGFVFHRVVRNFDWRQAKAGLVRYRQFLVYNTPYSLIGTVARDMPIFVFSAMSAPAAAGYYGLTRTVLLAPAQLTSVAISQVFYREAVALKGSGAMAGLTCGLLRLGLLASAPLFALCVVWGDLLFTTVFGAKWLQAGHFAMIMAPAAWMSLQTGWPERLFEVAMRQDASFKVQVASDIVTTAAVIAPLALGMDLIVSIAAFTVANIAYHFVYLGTIFRVSGFGLRPLAAILGQGWLIFGAACLLFGALRALDAPLAGMAASIAAGAAAALFLGRKLWKNANAVIHTKETES